MVHILILVGQHAIELASPSFSVGLVRLHGARGPEAEIAEIGSVSVAKSTLIGGMDAGARPQPVEVYWRFSVEYSGYGRFDPS